MAFTNMIIGQFSFCDKNMELCQGKYQHLAVEDKNIQIVEFHRIEYQVYAVCLLGSYSNFYACSTDIKIIWDYNINSVN